MTDRDPKPNDLLSPYAPAQVPSVPGSGRAWFAIGMALLLAGAAYSFVSLL